METILNPTNPQPAPLPPRVRARLRDGARAALDAAERELSDLAPAQCLTERRRD